MKSQAELSVWNISSCAVKQLVFCVMAMATFFWVCYLLQYSVVKVSSNSMESSLFEGDRIILRRCAYLVESVENGKHRCSPERGQIIVFRSNDNQSLMVKRVVAVAGERVQVRAGRVVVNGVLMPEPYVRNYPLDQRDDNIWPRPGSNAISEVQVPEKSYFVMADNREGSVDSRVLGSIPLDKIVGVMALRLPRSASGVWITSIVGLSIVLFQGLSLSVSVGSEPCGRSVSK